MSCALKVSIVCLLETAVITPSSRRERCELATPNKTLLSDNSHFRVPFSPQPLASTSLLSVSKDLPVMNNFINRHKFGPFHLAQFQGSSLS